MWYGAEQLGYVEPTAFTGPALLSPPQLARLRIRVAGSAVRADCCSAECGRAHRNLVGLGKALKGESGTAAADSAAAAASTASTGPLARAEALALLREDYDESYFVSGKGSMAAYASDCTFADPFVSFDGVRRFQANVANLGGLMEDIDLKITKWEETDEALETSWRFSCVLALPWRPKLAAAGGTTHVFDRASGRVIKHVERWDVEPGKVVKELLCVRTALKCSQMPSNAAPD